MMNPRWRTPTCILQAVNEVNIKAVTASFRKQAIEFLADPQWIIPSIVAPFIFTVVVLMMYPDRSGTVLLQAILGGGVLGMWGNTLFASGYSLSYDRVNGTLEPLLLSPTNMFDVIVGRSIWNTFIGIVNMVFIYIFAVLAFNTEMTIADPLAFVVTMQVTLFSLSCVGLIFSVTFVFSRKSYILTGMFEYPLYVLSGAVIPITLLPEWTNPISMILPPTWGVEALRASAIEGYSTVFGFGMWGNTLICILVSLVYVLIARAVMSRIVREVQKTGSFAGY